MKLPAEQRAAVRLILRHKANSFVAIGAAVGLNPAKDYRGTDLRGIDFGDDDLRGFDFSGADLTGANLSRARGLDALRSDEETIWGVAIATDPPLPEGFSHDAVVALLRTNRRVPAAWIPFVTDLDMRGIKIRSADRFAALIGLRKLNLSKTAIWDVTPLARLTALQTLDLSGTRLRDATPLAGLTALQTLNLAGTQVSDATPLAGLTALQILDLGGTQVGDIKAVRRRLP